MFTLQWVMEERAQNFSYFSHFQKKNPWLLSHHNSSSEPTVSANMMPIRTALFLSTTLPMGEQKILYNPLLWSWNSKLLFFPQWTSLSQKKKKKSLHHIYIKLLQFFVYSLKSFLKCMKNKFCYKKWKSFKKVKNSVWAANKRFVDHYQVKY